MNIQQLYEYCLSKKGVTEHFPFDQDTLVFKVGGKMFALTSLSNWEKEIPAINLKCDPKVALELRDKFEGINPGFHMSKVHWNTVTINEDVPDKKVLHLINHSYELVFSSLTKKIKTEIENLEN
ncbi:MmcQ/YjbR family DNA-binding protein [Flavobacterium gelidilacus]|jgi:predicted DNA-binding protein (MmcQ/YjbR family)|uniref:MmcQ/YjbR family DNA-binding protein n=1 Tax=Flavobacterium gelidilacus TaxID=206041 RepID=UPI00040D8296|nr:MmcQ/YjbR family DNA-binding protein [Flavobacterium gelidilacus]